MKAISLIQPWATLLATGVKTIETRSQRTSHRGPVAIHASKTWPIKRGETLEVGRYVIERPENKIGGPESDRLTMEWTVNGKRYAVELWRGCVVGYGRLIAVKPTEEIRGLALDRGEFELGDYTPGRYGWLLDGLHQVNPPLNVSGALGVWELPGKAAELVEVCMRVDADVEAGVQLDVARGG